MSLHPQIRSCFGVCSHRRGGSDLPSAQPGRAAAASAEEDHRRSAGSDHQEPSAQTCHRHRFLKARHQEEETLRRLEVVIASEPQAAAWRFEPNQVESCQIKRNGLNLWWFCFLKCLTVLQFFWKTFSTKRKMETVDVGRFIFGTKTVNSVWRRILFLEFTFPSHANLISLDKWPFYDLTLELWTLKGTKKSNQCGFLEVPNDEQNRSHEEVLFPFYYFKAFFSCCRFKSSRPAVFLFKRKKAAG